MLGGGKNFRDEKKISKKNFSKIIFKKKLEFFFNPGKIFFPEVQIYLKSKHCVLKILALYAYIFTHLCIVILALYAHNCILTSKQIVPSIIKELENRPYIMRDMRVLHII